VSTTAAIASGAQTGLRFLCAMQREVMSGEQ
jgi:hypothetical protein